MDRFSLYIKGVCLVSILSGVLSAVIPGGRMKKSFASLCAVILISSLVAPLSDFVGKGFDLSDFSFKKNEEKLVSDIRTAEVMLCESIVGDMLKKKLEENGISCEVKITGKKHKEVFSVTAVAVSVELTDEEKSKVKQLIAEWFPEAETYFGEG